MKHNASSEAIYGLGVIGAAVYFVLHSATIPLIVWGLVKAAFWPAVVVYKVLELLKL